MDGVFFGSEQFPELSTGPVVTIGNFDGVHRGHRSLLNRTIELATSLNVPACAFTFDPAPRDVLRPDNPVVRIQRREDRIGCLLAAGMDYLVVEPFSLEYAQHDARWFAEEVLVKRLGASAVVVGWDFRFGRGRQGGVDELKRWLSVPVEQVSAFQECGETVSSSRIRFALYEGRVSEAKQLLGRCHEVVGDVVSGDGRGTQLGFPTANISAQTPLVPANGVYAVRVLGLTDDVLHGVCNIGERPTFGEGRRQIEVFILDHSGDFYGQQVRVCFVERLRDEVCFDSPEALVSQINADVAAAREILDVLER